MSASPLIFGEVLFDCFEDGSVVLGGAPFNVAWHLQAFGSEPLFVSRVGDDALARSIRSAMQAWGMRTAGLQKDSAHATGEVRVSIRDDEPHYEIMQPRAFDFIQADMLPKIEPALIYHGSLGLRGETSAATLERIKSDCPAPVFLDVNLRPPFWEKEQLQQLMNGARWVKLNEDELDALYDGQGSLEARIAGLMQTHDLQRVYLTRGADGALVVDRDGDMAEVRPEAGKQLVDTVGAGDAFASVCILGILEQWPLQTAIRRAQSFASEIVARRGATVNEPDFYQTLVQSWTDNT